MLSSVLPTHLVQAVVPVLLAIIDIISQMNVDGNFKDCIRAVRSMEENVAQFIRMYAKVTTEVMRYALFFMIMDDQLSNP